MSTRIQNKLNINILCRILNVFDINWSKLIYDHGWFTFNLPLGRSIASSTMAVDPPQSVVPATDGCGTTGNSNRSRNGGDFLLKCIQFSCVSFLNLTFSWNSVHLWEILGGLPNFTLLKGQFWNRSYPPLKSLAGSHLRSSCNSSWPKHELVMHEVQVLHCNQVFVDISKTWVSSHMSWIQIFVSVHIYIYTFFYVYVNI